MLTMYDYRRRNWTRRIAIALTTMLFLAGGSFMKDIARVPAMGGPRVVKAAQVHVVGPGESLWLIADSYGITVSALRETNGKWDDLIRPGERFIIPEAPAVTAMAAVKMFGATAAERDLLARLVRAEAEDQPYAGKVAVAAVVLNRSRSGLFPRDIQAVIYERNQFEPVMNGQIWLPAHGDDHRAVVDALGGWDPSFGALYFFNPAKTVNSFLWSRPMTTIIGGHRFTL